MDYLVLGLVSLLVFFVVGISLAFLFPQMMIITQVIALGVALAAGILIYRRRIASKK